MNRIRYKVNELVIITTKDENVPVKRVPSSYRHGHQRRRSDEKSVRSRGSLLLILLSSLPPQFLAHRLAHFSLCESTVGIQLSAVVSVGVEI